MNKSDSVLLDFTDLGLINFYTEDELMKVIASYVSITKKPFGQRKSLKNVHSIIMTEKDW